MSQITRECLYDMGVLLNATDEVAVNGAIMGPCMKLHYGILSDAQGHGPSRLAPDGIKKFAFIG